MFDRFSTLRSLPSHLRLPSRASKIYTFALNNLNFYRIHLLCFTFIPLIMSGIMYGISTAYQIPYIDCLFNCMSAMTVTGLATINLSTMSVMQQVLLFIQMTIGSLTFVSILMILVRLHFFRQKFKHIIQEQRRLDYEREKGEKNFSLSRTMSRVNPVQGVKNVKRRLSMSLGGGGKDKASNSEDQNGKAGDTHNGDGSSTPPSSFELKPVPPTQNPVRPTPLRFDTHHKPGKKGAVKINKDMIKRVEGGGVGMVNPMGWYENSPGHTPGDRTPAGGVSPGHRPVELPEVDAEAVERDRQAGLGQGGHPDETVLQKSAMGYLDHRSAAAERDDSGSAPTTRFITNSPDLMTDPDRSDSAPTKTPYAGRAVDDETFPRAKTIVFEDDDDGLDHDRMGQSYGQSRGFTSARDGNGFFPRTATSRSVAGSQFPRINTGTTASGFPRTYSLRPSVTRAKQESKLSGFGGFPTPLEIGKRVFEKAFPERAKTIKQTMTMPRTNTIGRKGTIVPDLETEPEKEVPYISFAAVVGRNSRFEGLTEEQMEELGGIEYRALRILLWIVIGYFLFVQLSCFVIIAPYIMAGGRYDYVFDAQPQQVSIPWFALFQAVSAFSNTGMSLADQSMIPFQEAYLMVALVVILIFAGNTAYPVFLRLTVWIIYKISPKASRHREELKFLLDHPRRCFVYMFPATQTWVLATVMFSLYFVDFVCFLVLDIGTDEIQRIPVGTRISAAFLQSAAVRAAGFAIVPLAALAPAVKVLYVIMMYISVYPIALSVRATNVYEEKSLGLFEEDEENMEDDTVYGEKGAQAVAKYVGWHARRQLAFDIWWLGFALWLICIIERGNIVNTENATWFNIFNIIFEIVSAYGTVGLSLGVPYDNFSFVGSWSVLGKLVLTLVMLRGRHRGLPVAIDRAVMLPKDFTVEDEEILEQERSRRLSRQASSLLAETYPEVFRRDSLGQQTSRRGSQSPQNTIFNPLVSPGRRGSSIDRSGLASPRRTSSPGPGPGMGSGQPPIHRRTNSMSSPPLTAGNYAGGTTSLSFDLPQAPGRGRSPVQTTRITGGGSGGAGGGGGGSGNLASGQLSPVKESGLSREPTMVAR